MGRYSNDMVTNMPFTNFLTSNPFHSSGPRAGSTEIYITCGAQEALGGSGPRSSLVHVGIRRRARIRLASVPAPEIARLRFLIDSQTTDCAKVVGDFCNEATCPVLMNDSSHGEDFGSRPPEASTMADH